MCAEEELFDDPWKLLVACMLLNKTTGKQVGSQALTPFLPKGEGGSRW